MGNFSQIIDELSRLSSKDPLLKKSNKERDTRDGPFVQALEINNPENKKLKLLSSLNNWFIFQKY